MFFTCIGAGFQLSFVPIEFLRTSCGKPSWSLAVAGSAIRIFEYSKLKLFVQIGVAMINSVTGVSIARRSFRFSGTVGTINVEVSA